MNWGKGIIIAMTMFIAFIVYMVVGFFSHKVDLESEDYYEQEISYEEEISSLNNANNVQNKPVVSLTDAHVVIQFDAEHSFDEAKLNLIRPDDETEDKSFTIKDTKLFTVDKKDLKKGVYQVELFYDSQGLSCLQKEEIYI